MISTLFLPKKNALIQTDQGMSFIATYLQN